MPEHEIGYDRLKYLPLDAVLELYLRGLLRFDGTVKPGQLPFSQFWKNESRFIPVLATNPQTKQQFEPIEEKRRMADTQLKDGCMLGVLDYQLDRATEFDHLHIRNPIAASILYFIGTPLFMKETDEGVDVAVDYLAQVDAFLEEFGEPLTARQFLLRRIVELNRSIVGEKKDLGSKKMSQQLDSISELVSSLANPPEWSVIKMMIGEITIVQALAQMLEYSFLAVGRELNDPSAGNFIKDFSIDMYGRGFTSVLFAPAMAQIFFLRSKYGESDWRLVGFCQRFKAWIESGEASDRFSNTGENGSEENLDEDADDQEEEDIGVLEVPMVAGMEHVQVILRKLVELAYEIANPADDINDDDKEELINQWEAAWAEIFTEK